jgi:hypothetical protein
MQPDLAHTKSVRATENVPDGRPLKAQEPARYLKWVVLVWALGIAAFHLGCAVKGRSIYRDIHLGAALEYSKGSIDLLKPIIVGFNLNRAPTPQELPIWQAAAGLAFKLFGPWFGWANLISLLFFFSGLLPIYKLAERYAGEGTGWWALLLFLAQPLVVIFAGTASPDGFSLVSAVWFLYFAMKLREEPRLIWLAAAVLVGALAAVCKLPFFLAAGVACAGLTLAEVRQAQRPVIWLAAAAAGIGILFFAWSRYMMYCYSLAELPLVDLRASSSGMKQWYFGDLSYRLNPGVWAKGGFRFLTGIFGSMGLAGLLGLAFAWRRPSRLAAWWFAGSLLATFIFFHLVFTHWHYYLMFAPAVAILCAEAALKLEAAATRAGLGPRWLSVALFAGVLGLGAVQGVIDSHLVLQLDGFPYRMAEVIRKHTAGSEKLLIRGGGWGGQMLFLSDRNGLSIWDSKLLEDEKTYARLKSLGFTKLVMVSETPVQTAIRESNSPNAGLQRESYRAAMTPIVDTLPTVFQSEDILIKELR